MAAVPDVRARVQRNLPLLTWFTFLTGVRVYAPVTVLYFHEFGLSTASVAVAWSVCYGAHIAFDWVTGLVADYWGYRKSLILGCALFFMSFLTIAITPMASIAWWWLAAGMAGMGIAASLIYPPTVQAFARRSTDWLEEQGAYFGFAGKSMSKFQYGGALGTVVAFGLLSLHGLGGMRLVWVVQSVLTLCLLGIAYCTIDLAKWRHPVRRSLSRSVAKVKAAFEARQSWSPIVIRLLPLFAITLINETVSFTVQSFSYVSGFSPGGFACIFCAGYVAGGFVAAQMPELLKRVAAESLISGLGAVVVASRLAITVVPPDWQVLAAVCMLSPVGSPFVIIWNILIPVSERYRATTLSMYATANNIGFVLLCPALGWLAAQWSFNAACLISAAAFSLCFIAAMAVSQRTFISPEILSMELPPS
jgi:MFS family permease